MGSQEKFGLCKDPISTQPNGVLRTNDKWPNGISLFPWKCGRHVWMSHGQIPMLSHMTLAGVEASSVVAKAEYHKRTKYQELDSEYRFVPLAIETSGTFSPARLQHFFFTDLGK